jgi:hypothetical protein
MPKIPRIKPKPKPPQCKICASPQQNAINQRIVRGDSIQSIAKDFGCCRLTMNRHAGIGNDKHGVPHKAHYVSQVMVAKARMDGKAGLDLIACQQKVWDDAQEAIDYALGRKAKPKTGELNLAAFGQCIAPQVKIIEVLAKISPDAGKDVESDGMIEALKATAKDDWKDARPVQMATTESETAASNELDAA